MPKISACIVAYCDYEEVCAAVRSILQHTPAPAQNLGFGKGHNAVIPRLDSAVHFILNPDILLTEDVLEPMADWLLARKGAAMATPQLRYPDGRLQHLPRRKPTPWLLLARQLAPRFGGCFAKADDHDSHTNAPFLLLQVGAAGKPCPPLQCRDTRQELCIIKPIIAKPQEKAIGHFHGLYKIF